MYYSKFCGVKVKKRCFLEKMLKKKLAEIKIIAERMNKRKLMMKKKY